MGSEALGDLILRGRLILPARLISLLKQSGQISKYGHIAVVDRLTPPRSKIGLEGFETPSKQS